MTRTALLVAALGLAASARADDAQGDFFERKVRPLLEANCFGCHGPEKQKAGLRLDTRDAALRGGDSGPVVHPGDPEHSRLMEVVRYDDEIRMPPKKKLDPAEIAALSDWIKAGAPWPNSREPVRPATPAATFAVSADDRGFWAFQPIGDPPLPSVHDSTWPLAPIDRFVLARLEATGLHPVARADRSVLLRRVTFDLTGLPPSPEEIDAFVADCSPDAFARVVDRLLGSPRHGERWARHWLDIARYAEDQAHSFQPRLYPYGYRYRDWVVGALNADMPYDRFVTNQIAGDLLDGPDLDDRRAATGLFALGPVYYGGAVFDELDDRVDVLTRGLLGLTVSCARCHDHKYDPIGQSEYYGLAGVFQSTAYKEYPDAPPEVVKRYDDAQAAIKARTDDIADFLRSEAAAWSERQAAESTTRYAIAAWSLLDGRKSKPETVTAEVARREGIEPFLLDRWVRFLTDEQAKSRPYLARLRELIARQQPDADLAAGETARAAVVDAAYALQAYVRATLALRDALKQQQAAAAAVGPGESLAAKAAPDGPEAKLVRDLLAADGLFALPRDKVEGSLSGDAKTKLKTLRADLERRQKDAPPKYPVIHSLADKAAPGSMRIHLRGNPATLGAEAPRRFLGILSRESTPDFTAGSGRLELARAIASRDNPLTARVIVNRVWAQHFGRGLVATPSNFGRLGERPSHPELLDHLAHQFIASGWSLKALHRAILLSATYQLASATDSQAQEVDPANLLLWRANRRRLEVEPWRDAMLAASGQLDEAVSGPSHELASGDNHRRTLYGKVSRHNLDGLLRLFDFPDPNLTSDRRLATTVPLQQLFVLNSPFLESRAKALAARLNANTTEPDTDRIRRAYLLLFGRPAGADDVATALEFLQGRDEVASRLTRWERYAQALLGTNEFAFID
jgi:hypothetical protein